MQEINSPQRAITAQNVKSAVAGSLSAESSVLVFNRQAETRAGYLRNRDLGYAESVNPSLVSTAN